LLKSIDNLFDLEVFPSKMFRNFIQRFLDILELVLDPPYVLLVNRSKAVPLQGVVIVVRGGIPIVVLMGIQDCCSKVINYYHNHLKNVQCHWHDVQSYSCPQAQCLAIEEVNVIEVEVILTGHRPFGSF
jgi:hypothetical protein